MEALDPTSRTAALADLDTARQCVNSGVCAGTDRATALHWDRWRTFCVNMAIDPLLQTISDPVFLLQIFAVRYRSGEIAPSGGKVRSRTVEASIRAIGQTIAGVGARDPRLNDSTTVDFRLTRMWASYKRVDAPPKRVKPVPICIIRHILGIAVAANHTATSAIAAMVVLAFFFLLRPGEYTSGSSESTPFTLADVQMFIGSVRLDHMTCPYAMLHRSTFTSLEFTNQKNGIRGEVIGLGRSGSRIFCPVHIVADRIIHLRMNNAPPGTPLSHFYHRGKWCWVTPADVTAILRNAVVVLGASVGFTKKDISARSLRASGAMALLCANIDHDRIKLIGRWRSDEMLKYLHVQCAPVMKHFAKAMINDGDFTLIPNRHVENPTVPLH